jgi:hypothetical protein
MIAWLWSLIVSALVWLSADPHSIAVEPARCSAAVAVARATVLGAPDRRAGVESVETGTVASGTSCVTCVKGK